MSYLRVLVFAVLAMMVTCQKELDVRTPPTPSQQADCRTIEHQQGTTEVCGQPQRIAVLGPFVLEPLLALGIQPSSYADHVAWHQGDYDNPSQDIPYLGEFVTQPLINLGLASQPAIETLLKTKPDLILGTNFNNADQYQTLSKVAPTILLKWDEADTNLRVIAQAIGHPEKAQPLLTDMRQKVETYKDDFATFVAAHPNILLLSSSQLQDIYVGNSAHGLCSSLLADLGFNLISPKGLKENQPGAPVPVSLEALTQAEADALILLGSDFNQSTHSKNFREHQLSSLKQVWEKNAIAQSLKASKAGRVYFIPAYLCLGLPGPIGTELYLNELKQQLLNFQARNHMGTNKP